jgi:hypothetical protein
LISAASQGWNAWTGRRSRRGPPGRVRRPAKTIPHRFDRLAALPWTTAASNRIGELGKLPTEQLDPGVALLRKTPTVLVVPGGHDARVGPAAIKAGLAAEGVDLALAPDGSLDVLALRPLSADQRAVIDVCEEVGLLSRYEASKPVPCAFCGKPAVTVAYPRNACCVACLAKTKAKR